MKRKIINRFFIYLILVIIIIVTFIPIINMVGTSFKSQDKIFTDTNIFPKKITWANYLTVIKRTSFPTYLKNSLIITLIVTISSSFIALLGAYAISRFRKMKFFSLYSKLLLVIQMFPLVLLLIPLFIVFRTIGVLNTRIPIVMIYITVTLPFSIWMMSGFFDGIPREMEESGLIDGCNQFQSFFLLVLPVASPGIAAIAIFNFLFSWNEYLLASIFLKQENLRTLPLGLQTFISQYDAEWGSLMAGSVLTIIPTIIFLIFMQKYIVQGLTQGAVKG